MSMDGLKREQIAALTALTAQEINFSSLVQWVRITNNQPGTIFVLGHGDDILFEVWPGDVFPYDFGAHDYAALRMYTDVNPAAADRIYINFRTKRREA